MPKPSPIATLALAACLGAAPPAIAQSSATPQQITVTAARRAPVEKSYRRMIEGLDHFEAAKAARAPQATLRFKLLPRVPGTDMDQVKLELLSTDADREIPIAPDRSFMVPRDALAWQQDAVVTANRRKLTMTWRVEIRSPGLPPGTRRLGDLRLECEVGHIAGLISPGGFIGRIAGLFSDYRAYCGDAESRYLFFAERPLFGVTLVAGARRESLPIDRLFAMASDDPEFRSDLPDCDCEALVDRTYFLPLGDASWPDDTRVEFDYQDGAP